MKLKEENYRRNGKFNRTRGEIDKVKTVPCHANSKQFAAGDLYFPSMIEAKVLLGLSIGTLCGCHVKLEQQDFLKTQKWEGLHGKGSNKHPKTVN